MIKSKAHVGIETAHCGDEGASVRLTDSQHPHITS